MCLGTAWKASREGMLELFFPIGKNANKIGSCVCFTESEGLVLSKGNARHKYAIRSQQSESFSVDQPILQITAGNKDICGSFEKNEIFLAARTPYQVHWLTSQLEDDEILFQSKGYATFEDCTSHVAWNPHLQGEAAAILENGDIQIFDLNSQQKTWTSSVLGREHYIDELSSSFNHHQLGFIQKKRKRGKVIDDNLARQWWSCEFSWHPQVILVAGHREIYLLDSRQKHGRMQLQSPFLKTSLATLNYIGGLMYCNEGRQTDYFTSLARPSYNDIYQFAAASTRRLMLFDARQPKIPLLQWEHRMLCEPPRVLQIYSFSNLCSPLQHTFSAGNVILACACKTGDIHAFCYGPYPEVYSTNISSSIIQRNRDDLSLNDVLCSWGLPSNLTPKRVDSGERIGNKFEASVSTWERRQCNLFPKSYEVENVSGIFSFSHISQIPMFNVLHLTGSGLIISQSYRVSTKLDSTSCGFVRTTPKPITAIGSSAAKIGNKQYRMEYLPAFLNYIQNGRIWPTYIQDEVAWKTKDFCDAAITLHEHSFKNTADKLKDMCLQLIKETSHPFSIHEVSLKALWRILPSELAGKSLERVKGMLMKHSRTKAGLELPEILPGNDLASLVVAAADMPVTSLEQKEESILLGPALPLPVLLEVQQFPMISSSNRHHRKAPLISDGAFLARFSSDSIFKDHVNGMVPGSDILRGCGDWIVQVVEGFRKEALVLQRAESAISLTDSTDLWLETVQTKQDNCSKHLVFHKLDSSHLYFLPLQTFAHEAKMPNVKERVQLECASQELDASNGGSFEKPEFQNFIGSSEHDKRDMTKEESFMGSALCDGRDNTKEECFSKLDASLCPVGLSFKDSGDIIVKPEELDVLTGLKDQFQHWQTNFEPYVSYCNSHLLPVFCKE